MEITEMTRECFKLFENRTRMQCLPSRVNYITAARGSLKHVRHLQSNPLEEVGTTGKGQLV